MMAAGVIPHNNQNMLKLLAAIVYIGVVSSQILRPYHKAVGIPQAIRLRQAEAVGSSRISGGHDGLLSLNTHMGGLVVTLATNETSVCGSSLLTNTKSLTAAHCWYDGLYQAVKFEVVFNSLTLFNGGIRVNTSDVIVHENYNSITYSDDIAVIRTPWVDYGTFLAPINLPGLSINDTFVNANALVAGYGITGIWDTTDPKLMYTSVVVISNEKCSQYYGNAVTNKTICSEGQYGYAGPCDGDAGGALHTNSYTSEIGFKNVLIGVMSYGYGCGVKAPYLHTRVTAYIDWIQQK